MAPTVRKPLTLGFIGAGTTSTKNAVALLTDLIEADSGKARIVLPATGNLWSADLEGVADFALEHKYPLVLVTDDTTADHKPLKPYLSQAAEKIKAVNVVTKVVKITAEGSGKLIMLWDDEDDDCYNALELAEGEGVEALDLTAGLHKLEFTGDSTQEDQEEEEEDQEEADQEEPEGDDLDDMDEQQLQDEAEALGIDVEEYPEWEDVRDAIRAARAQGELVNEDNGTDDDGDDEEGVITPEAVENWDFAALKAYAQENNIEVPPRSKTFGYKKAILEFLAAADGHAAAVEREEEELLKLPADDDAPLLVAEEAAWKEYLDAIQADLDVLKKSIDAIGRAHTEHMIELRTMLMEVTKPGTVQKAQRTAADTVSQDTSSQAEDEPPAKKTVARKAAAPAKAPQKATAARKVNRPTAPEPPAPPAKERPLAPFMHLLGKKLTKAQAKEIVIASQLRGRGRPTEDERTLIAAAKELVPNV